MKLECKAYQCLCELEVFKINCINANYEDFGFKGDEEPDDADPYGCGNMQFHAQLATKEVLAKYGITLAEYAEVCTKLGEELSFGNCGWCV